MDAEFVCSEKGKRKLLFEGHFYFKDVEKGEKVYWKCAFFEKRKTNCPARIITVDDKISKITKEHNHIADASEVEATKVYEKIRINSKISNDPPHKIISTASTTCSITAAPKLPSVSSMKRSIRNIRQKNLQGPALPTNRSEIIFLEEYTKTYKNENFLLYDAGPVDERILIFTTEQNLQLLSNSKHWYIDGTFKTVPLLFQQLLTVHGLQHNLSVPLVYALLPKKSERIYDQFFQELKNLKSSLVPATITTDFEKALINACNIAFPSCRKRGCFFHFSQCIFRMIQRNGLKKRYETDSEFAFKLKMLCAIAFVPVDDIVMAFEQLYDSEIFPSEAESVINYFEDTWIGRPNRKQRKPPQYPYELWNLYQTVLDDLPRTNNSVEGWHRSFETPVSKLRWQAIR